MPCIRTTSKAAEAAPEYEVVYKYKVTGFNRGDVNNTKPVTDTIVLHFSGAPDRKEANQKAIAEFEKKHSDCYGDTAKLLDIQNIKKKYGLDEDVVKVMGHYIPKGIWTAISRFDTSNTDQRQTGFFGSAEMKKRYIAFTNSMAQYIEQNIKKAGPKEQGFIANNLKRLKTERDSLVSKLMVMSGGRNEGLTNFRFKDPKTADDLIGIEDFICEVYRRNKGEDATDEIQQRMDALQGQAGSQYIKEKGKDAWDKLEGAAYAQFLFNAIRSIVKDITQEDFRMVYTSPGTDREYLQEVVLCDKEVEPPEYRADDKYDFSSLRK